MDIRIGNNEGIKRLPKKHTIVDAFSTRPQRVHTAYTILRYIGLFS